MLYEPLPEQLYFLRKFWSSDNLDDEELAKHYLKFAYSLQYHYWVCEEKLDYIIFFMDFDTDGDMIVFYDSSEKGSWVDMSDDRYGETIISAICDLYNKVKYSNKKIRNTTIFNLTNFISNIKLLKPVSLNEIEVTVIPIFYGYMNKINYISLAEAIKSGKFEI